MDVVMEAKEKILIPVLAFSVLTGFVISAIFKFYVISVIFLFTLTLAVFIYERERKRSYNDKLQKQKLINENIHRAPVIDSFLLDSVMHLNNSSVNSTHAKRNLITKTKQFHVSIKLLGLPNMDTYSAVQIKQAYRQQVRLIHPDVNKTLTSDSSTEKMVALDEAKTYLLNKHVK